MKKSIVIGLGVVTCLAICAVVIYAQMSSNSSIPQIEVNARFSSADKNGDGVLSKKEFADYFAKIQQIKSATNKPVKICSETGLPCEHEDANDTAGEKGCCGETKNAETVQVKLSQESEVKSGCCGGKDKAKTETNTETKKESGCCDGKDKAKTADAKDANGEKGCCGGKDKAKTETSDSLSNTPDVSEISASDHAALKVGGSCGMCKKRIETAAKSLEGVVAAAWDTKTQILQVAFNSPPASLDEVSKAIAKVGHDTEKNKADDETYNALHGCCKYRK